MLTFLELYQTMLGFVFFKLYTDAGLVYPPPLDTKKDEGAAGAGVGSRTKLTIEDLERLELPPSVPKYYGYYIPVVDSEADDFNHNDCDAEGEHDVSHWPTPMLLMEDCGTPAVPSELKHVHKYVFRSTPSMTFDCTPS